MLIREFVRSLSVLEGVMKKESCFRYVECEEECGLSVMVEWIRHLSYGMPGLVIRGRGGVVDGGSIKVLYSTHKNLSLSLSLHPLNLSESIIPPLLYHYQSIYISSFLPPPPKRSPRLTSHHHHHHHHTLSTLTNPPQDRLLNHAAKKEPRLARALAR